MEKIFAWILDLMLMIFSIFFLTLGILGSRSFYFDSKVIQEYKENWSRGPIIEIISTSNECPSGYENLISNIFPGNKEGCDCTQSNYEPYKGNVYKTECDQYQLANSCKKISKHDNINLTTWRKQKLCALRMSQSFWELSTTNTNCSEAEKKCGIFDNFNNTFCVSQTEKCPINDIIILPNGNKPDFANPVMLKLDENYNLYYTNTEINKALVVEIEAREYPICAHPHEGELGENQYILNDNYGPRECTTRVDNMLIDERFTILDSESLIEFYNENNIFGIINKLPAYQVPKSNDVVSIFKINYFGWNKACFKDKNFKPNRLVSPQSDVDYYADKMYNFAMTTLFHFFFIMLSIVFYKIIFEKMKVSMEIVLFLDVINLIFLVIIFVMLVVTLNGTNNILMPYTTFLENDCGDKMTNNAFSLAFSSISIVRAYLIPLVVLAIIEIGYISGFYFWKFLVSKEEGNRYSLN